MPRFLCLQRTLPGGGGAKPVHPAGLGSAPGAPKDDPASPGGVVAPDAAPKPSPAQMQEMYERFGAWRRRFEDQLVDLGGRLGAGELVTAEVADGPFVEVKELVGGYMIVSADSLAQAIEVARACPGLVGPGSGVEVVEIVGP